MSERSRAEAKLVEELSALRESEEQFRILLSESPDSIFSLTPEGRYRFVNKAFAAGVDKPVEKIIGQTIWDVFPQEEADKRFAALSQVFRTGEGNVIEVRVPRADGDRYYLTTISPIRDARGSVVSAVCSSKEITDRKRAAEALEESRERYRAFSEAAFEAIFISEKGICLEQNATAEQMFGYSNHEAVGRAGTDWIAPQDRTLVLEHMLSGFEQPYDVTAQRKDGTTFPAMLCGKMMHFKGRNVRVTSLSNITERKKAEQTLRESEERLRRLIEYSPISTAIIRLDGTVEYINRRAIETFGYLPEEVPTLDRWWLRACPDESYRAMVHAEWKNYTEQALAGNEEFERREFLVTSMDSGRNSWDNL